MRPSGRSELVGHLETPPVARRQQFGLAVVVHRARPGPTVWMIQRAGSRKPGVALASPVAQPPSGAAGREQLLRPGGAMDGAVDPTAAEREPHSRRSRSRRPLGRDVALHGFDAHAEPDFRASTHTRNVTIALLSASGRGFPLAMTHGSGDDHTVVITSVPSADRGRRHRASPGPNTGRRSTGRRSTGQGHTGDPARAVTGGALWQDQANCLGVDPDLFFPERGASTREAKEVCRGCVVREACLEYALTNGEKFGIWGGMSERERRRLRRARALARRGLSPTGAASA